jgi:hypothetical protein
MLKRVQLCLQQGGGHFQHMLLLCNYNLTCNYNKHYIQLWFVWLLGHTVFLFKTCVSLFSLCLNKNRQQHLHLRRNLLLQLILFLQITTAKPFIAFLIFSSIRNSFTTFRHLPVPCTWNLAPPPLPKSKFCLMSCYYSSRHQIAYLKATEGIQPPQPLPRGSKSLAPCYVLSSELSLLGLGSAVRVATLYVFVVTLKHAIW